MTQKLKRTFPIPSVSYDGILWLIINGGKSVSYGIILMSPSKFFLSDFSQILMMNNIAKIDTFHGFLLSNKCQLPPKKLLFI